MTKSNDQISIKSNVDKFDEILRGLGERSATYGHPLNSFRRIDQIKDAVRECPDAALRHALEMIGVKMSRLVVTPDHFDSWVDIAGYARAAVMILDAYFEYASNSKKGEPK